MDLGCWPGGWLQAAADAVGREGRVVGVDLVEVEALPQPWVTVLVGDVADGDVRTRVAEKLGGYADVVLSDMAPKLSGVRDRDEARSADLVALAMTVAREVLRPGGHLIVKLFTSPTAEQTVVELRSLSTRCSGRAPMRLERAQRRSMRLLWDSANRDSAPFLSTHATLPSSPSKDCQAPSEHLVLFW